MAKASEAKKETTVGQKSGVENTQKVLMNYLDLFHDQCGEFTNYCVMKTSDEVLTFASDVVDLCQEHIYGGRSEEMVKYPIQTTAGIPQILNIATVGRRFLISANIDSNPDGLIVFVPINQLLGPIEANGGYLSKEVNGETAVNKMEAINWYVGGVFIEIVYQHKGMNYQRLLERFRHARDVLVSIHIDTDPLGSDEHDGDLILMDKIRTGPALEYHLPPKSKEVFDWAKWWALYSSLEVYLPGPAIRLIDQYIADTIVECFSEIHIPAVEITEAFQYGDLYEADIAKSREYRRSQFVMSIMQAAAKDNGTTVVLR